MPKMTFENALSKLEKIVHELESGDASLENAVKKYEEGMKLSRFCTQKLDQTEKKINLLIKDSDGNVAEQSFADAPSDEYAK